MVINPLGVIAALVIFMSIWIGHVAVRRIEARVVRLWVPMAIVFISGTAFEIAAITIPNRALSMTFGIIGFTLLWDVLELKRQAGRVGQGHAPANLNNPRHATMLAALEAKNTSINIHREAAENQPALAGTGINRDRQ